MIPAPRVFNKLCALTPSMPRRLLSLPALLLALAALAYAAPARANVTLVSFTAAPGNAQVVLEWETATEINTAGFFIRRSTEQNGVFERVSEFIPAQGDSLTGAVYQYTDGGLTNGMTYYYQLEAIDNDQSVEFFGPIDATPAGPLSTPTPTTGPTDTLTPTASPTAAPSGSSTPTLTRTPTRTPTRTAAPTRTPTHTRAPTRTPTPRPYHSPTATFTASPVPSATGTPTREFFSPPSPTLPETGGGYPPPAAPSQAAPSQTAPPETPAPRQTASPSPESASAPRSAPAQPERSAVNWRSRQGLAIGLAALVWVLLGLWLAYFISRVERSR